LVKGALTLDHLWFGVRYPEPTRKKYDRIQKIEHNLNVDLLFLFFSILSVGVSYECLRIFTNGNETAGEEDPPGARSKALT
jgi:hypothetical protein